MKNRVSNFVVIVLIAALMGGLSSCVPRNKVIFLQDKKGEIRSDFTAPSGKSYAVKPGDHLYIKIYSVDKQTSAFFQSNLPTLMNPTYLYLNSYTVDPDGFIDFSFIEKIEVKGKTVEQVKILIQEKLNEFFKETTVTVKLVNYQVTVLGEVLSPGLFTIDREQINVFQALGLARGVNDWGNREKVVVIRQTDAGSHIEYLDLTDKKILESEYYILQPDDVVYVEPLKQKSRIETGRRELIVASLTTMLLILTYLKSLGIPN